MPELPDILGSLAALEPRVLVKRLESVRLKSPFLLRSVSPPISRAEGRLVAALLLAALLLGPVPFLAAEQAPVPQSPRWTLAGGYGFSVQLNRGRSEEQMCLVNPGFAVPLSSRLEYSVEGHFAAFFSPGGYMIGVMPLGGRFFFGRAPLQPYVSVGVGFGWTDLTGLDEIDRRFNYLLQGSAGVRVDRSDGSAWTFEARLDHISNAGTVLPNLGLNSVVFLAGWRFR